MNLLETERYINFNIIIIIIIIICNSVRVGLTHSTFRHAVITNSILDYCGSRDCVRSFSHLLFNKIFYASNSRGVFPGLIIW